VAWPSERSRDGGIDEIPLPPGVSGRLFLCGKHAIGPDVDALLARVDATTAVCLNETHELDDRYPAYVAWLDTNAPARAVHHPIPDFHAPDLDDFVTLIDELYARLEQGERLVVQCGGGIGRSGTVACGMLVRAGTPLDEALVIVRANRPMAGPEVGAQADVLASYELLLKSRPRPADG
jgi:protein-tyrosine phosphatase